MSELKEKFNVNHFVKVKLTDVGRKKLEENYVGRYRNAPEMLTKYPYIPKEEDDMGWSEWQLYELMFELGSCCYNGCQVPFETEIMIDFPDRPNSITPLYKIDDEVFFTYLKEIYKGSIYGFDYQKHVGFSYHIKTDEGIWHNQSELQILGHVKSDKHPDGLDKEGAELKLKG